MDKKELRRKMIFLRSGADPRDAGRVAALLADLPEFRQAKRIFCYASYGTELPTAPIAALGKPMAYPKVLDRESMRFYEGGVLQPGYREIPEPEGGREVLPAPTDLMILPGLAFSSAGDRLGYGGGYYDRYLASLSEPPICCGVGYEFQLIEELPREPHDHRLELLVLPDRILRF